MPGHYRSPYGYSYFNPTGKEQAALTIGSLLAGALAASSGRSKGDAIRKGITGTMAGYGSGYQNYQNLMGDAFGRDLQAKSYGQRVKEHELSGEKFGQAVKEYEETEKPYKKAYTDYLGKKETFPAGMGRMNEYASFKGMTPEAQAEYLDYLSKTGYNRVLGTDEAGNPIFVPTRGNVQLKTPTNAGVAGTQTPPVSGRDIQPFVKPILAESAQENIARGDTLQQNINRVKGLYDKAFVGAGDALQGKIGEIYGGATNDKEKKFRSAVNSLYTNMFAEGGKALTENEKEILKPLFPSFWRGEENFLIDLGGLETKYRELMQARLQTHKDAGMRNIDNVQKGLTSPINQPQTADDFINLLEGK